MIEKLLKKKTKTNVLILKISILGILSLLFLFLNYVFFVSKNKVAKKELSEINILRKNIKNKNQEREAFLERSAMFDAYKKIYDENVKDIYKKKIDFYDTETIKRELLNIYGIDNIIMNEGDEVVVDINDNDKKVKLFTKKLNINFYCLYEKQIFEVLNVINKFSNTYIIYSEINIVKKTTIDKKFIKNITKNYFVFPLEVGIVFNVYYIKS